MRRIQPQGVLWSAAVAGVAVLAAGCSTDQGASGFTSLEQRNRDLLDVDTAGMTPEEAAEARRKAELRVRQLVIIERNRRWDQLGGGGSRGGGGR
ncbi:MAG: hypothetical protein AAFY08_07400 [Planctomycetota bacterium]